MSGVQVYCRNCQKCTISKPHGSGWITLILLLFYIVPGIIYEIWRNAGMGVCGSCGNSDILLERDKPIQQQHVQKLLADPFSSNSVSNYQQPFESVRQVNCPDCRELIRFDARKCKHCGSFVNDSKNSPL